MIKMIWAMDESCLIGANNKMPWHIKEDLIYYKNKTKDSAVLMGYNTYLSLLGYYQGKNFPYKETYVLSNTKIEDERVNTVSNLNEFLSNLNFDLFVVGGKNCYEQCMPYADELYVSYVLGKHEGDTYMKPIDTNTFELISSQMGESGKVRYTIYRRK
ncbi:MAG: dihydrofolate reductase [Acholeplasmatales bacterium]|nr:dihydrofolate reductase [Acholeplasmatales bacterium]